MSIRRRTLLVTLGASALIAGGAGAAYAATQGSAASKPSVVTPKRHAAHHANGNCPNMGGDSGTSYRPAQTPAM